MTTLNFVVRNGVIRMLDELPLDTWLTIDEVRERMQMRRWICIYCLTLMRRYKLIEVRSKDESLMSVIIAGDLPIETRYANLFEYRLFGRRRKRRLDFRLSLRDLVPDLSPAHA